MKVPFFSLLGILYSYGIGLGLDVYYLGLFLFWVSLLVCPFCTDRYLYYKLYLFIHFSRRYKTIIYLRPPALGHGQAIDTN